MKTRPTAPTAQRGIALITAIFIAALVATLAFALSARERLWMNQMENHSDFSAAQAIAFAAVDLACLTLRDDMRNNQADHLLEPWTMPIPPISVEEGKVGGRLMELQGRFNLFNLQNGGKINPTGVSALQRLLRVKNLPDEWASRMATVMASQVSKWESQQSGAKYPVRGKVFPVTDLSELADLAGLELGKLAALEPLVTVLPETTSINVNFASPEILMAITPGMTLAEAEQLISERSSAYFKTSHEYANALPERLRSLSGISAYTVESRYFLAEIDSLVGRAHVRFESLIYRQRNRMPDILWLKRI